MPIGTRIERIRNELRALFAIAIPMTVAQLATTAMGFVDTMMSGRVNAHELAAVALGNSIWVPMLLMMNGIILATTAKVAQHFGAGHHERIGPLVRQSLWMGLGIGLLCTLLMWNAAPLLRVMGVQAELVDTSMSYLRAVACGFPAMGLYQVLRSYSDGLGHSRPSMAIGILGLLLNIPLNYIFIYGKLGMPALGAVGCGWTTALVMSFMLAGMLFWIRRSPHYRGSALFARFDWPCWSQLAPLLALGTPIGIAVFAEVSIFSVIALLIGGLGETVISGHQISLSFTSLIFMIPLSLGMAVTVRVGQSLGRGAPRDARFVAGLGIATSLVYACFSASGMLLFSEPIARIYSTDPAVIAIASGLFVYAALFQFSDVVQVTAAGALRGYQDTRMTMIFTLFAYWLIGLPVGYLLGLTDWMGPPSGPVGLWQGLIAGLSCAALLLSLRLHYSAHRAIVKSAARARRQSVQA
ncbi:MATE family efflux transporter [Stutzerimonas kirkiae]|uniref:Multidrug-efflux transporter n=1 Tax=Stutzerimonas kirkiae TaxID=2211392 RepID=A0A4Q9R3Y8_9GAMM|nr:MATE family efflux transporter [Stutzerimonas kirkiae]TBU93507.1 MATE family efflux transporter [Stutzerimonas kirkiae]TBV01713.1 MATE family efflux transporter [Stutzerimonas kirkiae]